MSGRLEFHPVADIFPMLPDDELAALADDIAENDLLEPIWLHRDGRIIDGRNRYLACLKAGIEPGFRTYTGPDSGLLRFAVSLNLHRRHLTESQRSMIAARLANMRQGERTDLASIDARLSQEDAAELMRVSRESAQRAKAVLERGIPELADAVDKGEISVSAAAAAAAAPATTQQAWLAKAKQDRTARTAREMVRDETWTRMDLASLSEPEHIEHLVPPPTRPGPTGYRCVVIDPPWPMRKIEREERPDQGSALDYPTLDVECQEPCQTSEYPIAEGPAGIKCRDTGWDYECESIECTVGRILEDNADDDCHIYLWVTHKFLPAGLELLSAWGFRYQCVMTWRKNVGITPYSWMYDTEHVLFGRRGDLPLTQLGLRLSFEAPATGHSIKPDVFYERVRAASPSPRLDMFPGVKHEGFEPWGLEASHRAVI